MNDRINNRLTMVGACITVADTPEHRLVWDGNEPAEFETAFNALKIERAEILTIVASAGAVTTGAAEAKDVAETTLENAGFVLARSTALHLKKTNDLTRRAQVNFQLSGFQRLRDQNLVARCTTVRDIAQSVTAEPGAVGRGVTPARITALTNALTAYSGLINAPRAKIVDRTALIRDLETRTAALVDSVEDLDDLAVQFDGTDAGRLFGTAWNQGRVIVDAGHGPAPTPPPPGPTPPGPA